MDSNVHLWVSLPCVAGGRMQEPGHGSPQRRTELNERWLPRVRRKTLNGRRCVEHAKSFRQGDSYEAAALID